MNKRIAKKVVSVVLALALLASVCVSAFAANPGDALAGITWLTDANKGGAPDWALNATEAEQQATIAAIQAEYNYQYDEFGYDVGTVQLNSDNTILSPWPGNHVGVQFVGGDNTGYPFGTGDGRKMAFIRAYFPGMAFTLKGAAGAFWDKIPIGNEIAYTNGDSYIVQAVTDGFIVTNNNTGVTEHSGIMVGADAPDEVKAKMQYAYAAASAGITFGERVTLGYTDVDAVEEGDVYYQQIKSDAGESYIVAANDADEAYIVTGDVLTAWATTWTTESKFGVTGAPIGNAVTDENGVVTQEFEYATITVTPAAEEGAEPTVEIDYDVVVADDTFVVLTSADNYAVANGTLSASICDSACDGDEYDINNDGPFDLQEGEQIVGCTEPNVGEPYTTLTANIPDGAATFSGIVSLCDRGVAQAESGKGYNYIEIKVYDAEGELLNPTEDKYLVYTQVGLEADENGSYDGSAYAQDGYVTALQRVAFEVDLTELTGAATIEVVAYKVVIEGYGWARHTAFINTGFTVPVAEEDIAAAKAFTKAVKLLNAADTDAVRELRDMYDDMSAVARGAATIYNDFAAIEADAQANASYTIFEAENAIGGNAPVTFFESATIDEMNGDHQRNNPANYGGEGQDPLPEDAIITTACGGGAGQEITFTVYAPTAGARYLGISYATNDARPIGIKVVDADGVETAYPTLTGAPTGGWNVNYTYIYTTVELTAGENKIVLFGDGNWTPDFDCIAVEDTEIFATSATEGSIADEIASWSAKIDAEDLTALNKNIVTYDYGVIYGLDEDVVAGAEDDVMDGDKYTAKKVSFVEEAKDGVDVYKTFGLRMKNIGDHEPVVKFYVTYKVAGTEYTDNEYVTVYSDVVGAAAAATPDGE